ncbi:hypothetical protein [Natronohydrobacter thiooxidans]|uniref:hypothetical protein n=1 Tax=Natronohydrobacter thiooxidans TaxID=87172 RepID=UPI0008FF6B96|nr:hypothetical protein [Natronohydrobacter thiooxidans]
MEQIIAYCERTDFTYWSEPVNALSNGAFLLAALWVWPMTRGLPLARGMAVMLAVIGLGSFLWHTHATRWAALADVLPILGFILLYLFAATRDYLGASGVAAGAVTLAFLPYAVGFGWALGLIVPGLGANAAYLSVAALIAGYGLYLRGSATGRGLLIGAAILCVSLGFRMLDRPICAAFPLGTHFMWHILNAVMLGWMIRVYCRHLRRA